MTGLINHQAENPVGDSGGVDADGDDFKGVINPETEMNPKKAPNPRIEGLFGTRCF